MCRQSEVFYEPSAGKKTKENEVRWLEWQANRLAPRILMPRDSFKRKAMEIISDREQVASCDALVEALSGFFEVSRSSVRYRLLEVGLSDQISKFEDYEDVFAQVNHYKEYVRITPAEAYEMVKQDTPFSSWVKKRFLFVDGYFVLPNGKYVTLQDGRLHLTANARRNLSACVINIREQKYSAYPNVKKDLAGLTSLYRVGDVDKRILTFDPKFQVNFSYDPEEAYGAFYEHILEYDEEEERELMRQIGDPSTTLCQCLWFLMENRNWRYLAVFSEKTMLHVNYYGKIKNNHYNHMGTDVLMAICIGLGLNLRITEKVFEKSHNKLDFYNDPDKTYVHILENLPGLSIEEFNSILEKAGLKPLGSEMRES